MEIGHKAVMEMREKNTAKYWQKLDRNMVQCNLCNQNCVIHPGKNGLCDVRENRNGTLISRMYGLATTVHADPIEKKPLYHFMPGTKVLSYGTLGCNLKCKHCQNFETSQCQISELHLKKVKALEVPELIKKSNCSGVAWTYNEPTVWFEFTLEGSKAAKASGYYTCYVSNGYIKEEPLREIAPYLDAINIDVKAFTDKFYRQISSARLEPVLSTCKLAKELGIHLELTYLLIPGLNDDAEELDGFCNWVVKELGTRVPIHFSRFHPDYKLTHVSHTPATTMEQALRAGVNAGLEHVYLGNMPHTRFENTYCPDCGALVVERVGHTTKIVGLDGNKCKKCLNELPIVVSTP